MAAVIGATTTPVTAMSVSCRSREWYITRHARDPSGAPSNGSDLISWPGSPGGSGSGTR